MICEKKSCEHTIIRNCLLDKGHGGIVIGSEMSGGVKDMVVTQCLMDHTGRDCAAAVDRYLMGYTNL